MKTISEDQFWIMFNEYLMMGFDERNAEASVLTDYNVNWEHRD